MIEKPDKIIIGITPIHFKHLRNQLKNLGTKECDPPVIALRLRGKGILERTHSVMSLFVWALQLALTIFTFMFSLFTLVAFGARCFTSIIWRAWIPI